MFEDRDWLMTQQAEADDRGDGAAGDVATHGTHTCRQDPPGGEEADQGCVIGMDQLLALWPWRHLKDAAPTEMRTDLARLESAFPAFSFTICNGWGGPRIEAWRDTSLSGLYAIITDDPRELWRELDMAVR
jgi:hypothetical protein